MKHLILAIALLLPFQASAYTIGADDIGGIDTFLVSGPKLGSTDSEALWVQSVVGDPTVNWTVKVHNVPYSPTVEDATIFGFELLLSPEYFIVKNSITVALFENVNSLDWGVFDSAVLPGSINIPTDPFIISHVTSLDGSDGGGGGGIDNIPEPSLPILLGIGLVGIGIIRKVT